MLLEESISKRVSIRKWQDKKIEREKLLNVMEAARRAPSWGNSQPWRFVVVEDHDAIKTLAQSAGSQPVMETAPAVIICAGDFDDFSKAQMTRSIKELASAGVVDITDEEISLMLSEANPYAVIEEEAKKFRTREQIVIATAYITLAAVGQGLGTCWIGAFDAEMVQKEFGLPDNMLVHALLAIGYPGEAPSPRPRKPFEDIVFWERYDRD